MSFLRPRDEGADAESGMSDSPHHALLGAERVAAARKEETARRVQILLVCCAYALTGPTLVLANNHILKRLGFPYPLMLSACGLLTTSVVCALIHHVRHWRRQRAAGGDAQEGVELQRVNGATPLAPGSPAAPSTPGGRRDAPPQVSWRFWLLNMVPIGAAQGVTFAATNAAYMHLTITFTQMLAAFTPTVTMVLLYLLNVESPSTRAAACVLLISIGSAVSAYGEGNFHPVGGGLPLPGHLLRGAAPCAHAEAAEEPEPRRARAAVLPRAHRRHLPASRRAKASAELRAPFISGSAKWTHALQHVSGAGFSEMGRFRAAAGWEVVGAHPAVFAASCALGVCASMLTFLVIKLTNSVTLKVTS